MKITQASLLVFTSILAVTAGTWFWSPTIITLQTESTANLSQDAQLSAQKIERGAPGVLAMGLNSTTANIATNVNAADNTQDFSLDQDAIASMREARLHGDSRSPSLLRSEPSERASAQEMADPDLYLQYQAKQRSKIFVSYVQAAKPKLEKLRALVAAGEAQGISAEQLAEGRDKIQQIEVLIKKLKDEHQVEINPDE